MYDIEAYRKSVRLKESIRVFEKTYYLSGNDKLAMSRQSHSPAYSRLEKEFGSYPAMRMVDFYASLCGELRGVRVTLRHPPHQRASTLEDIITKGLSRARNAVNMLFARHSFSTVSSDRPSLNEKRSYYSDLDEVPQAPVANQNNVLGIPKSWLRSVDEQGLTAVAGGSGPCFIMSAKRRKSSVFETEYFSVVALKAKGKAFILEDGWVARAHGITAYSDDLKKVQSLLNRRVRAKIMREFLGE